MSEAPPEVVECIRAIDSLGEAHPTELPALTASIIGDISSLSDS